MSSGDSVQLPFVLAGPILRRTSSKGVWVWIAFSRALDFSNESLEFEIYPDGAEPSADDLRFNRRCKETIAANYTKATSDSSQKKQKSVPSDAVSYIKVLDQLHTYLLCAKPFSEDSQKKLTSGLLAYEIFLVRNRANEKKRDEKKDVDQVRYGLCEHVYPPSTVSRKIIDSRMKPVYSEGYSEKGPFQQNWRPQPRVATSSEKQQYIPCFRIGSGSDTVIWSGSCFKLHGKGTSATTVMYSSEPGGSQNSLLALRHGLGQRGKSRWPEALFLTGDQIYGDDVSLTIFKSVHCLARLLRAGKKEDSPAHSLSDIQREQLLKGKKVEGMELPFTVDDKVKNHLMTLSEYSAYYLIHWNAALWIGFAQLKAEARFLEHYEQLEKARVAVRDYATVLACVPVYAMCDDHDVTDDWFFDVEWMSKVGIDARTESKKLIRPVQKGQILAQAIIADALHAYAVFLGIGNDPENFLSENWTRHNPKRDASSRLEWILNIDWSFVAPTSTPAAFLDTRTKRHGGKNENEFISEGSREHFLRAIVQNPAARDDLDFTLATEVQEDFGGLNRFIFDTWMTTHSSLKVLLARIKEVSRNKKLLLLITPSPVLGIDSIEKQKSWASLASRIPDPSSRIPPIPVRYRVDSELWRSNLSNYFALIKALLSQGIERCIVVSGDVHFGYKSSATVHHYTSDLLSSKVKINQVVSSALLNEFSWKDFPERPALTVAGGNQGHLAYVKVGDVWEVSNANDALHQKRGREFFTEQFNGKDENFVASKSDESWRIENNFVELIVEATGAEMKLVFFSR